MKVKLTTGTEYDISDNQKATDLIRNIRTMKSREQYDRLKFIYDQIQHLNSPQGKTAVEINATKMCKEIKPVLIANGYLKTPVTNATQPQPAPQITLKPAAPINTLKPISFLPISPSHSSSSTTLSTRSLTVKVKLTTSTEYDISDNHKATDLIKNIRTMKSREQYDRLKFIYDQIQHLNSPQGKTAVEINATQICKEIKPALIANGYLKTPVANAIQPQPAPQVTLKPVAPINTLKPISFLPISPSHSSSSTTLKKPLSAIVKPAAAPATAPNPQLKQYLGLPQQPLNDSNPNYIIAMAPINSSGDIYHIAAYALLALARGLTMPDVLLTYDATETKNQVARCQKFMDMLSIGNILAPPIQVNLNPSNFRENNRQCELHKHLNSLDKAVYYVDQKALTTIIANEFLIDKTKCTQQLHTAFGRRNLTYFNPNIQKEIQSITTQWINEIQKSLNNKPLLIFHIRHSAGANSHQGSSQNLPDNLVQEIQSFLTAKGYVVWFIFADSRKYNKSFAGIQTNRISPFSLEINTKILKHANNQSNDYAKILHLEILDKLLSLPTLKGIIGNTSGTLDLAAFIGHRVYNIHQFTTAKIRHQDYRILIQATILTVESLIQEELDKFSKREITDVSTLFPSLLHWLNGVGHSIFKPHGIADTVPNIDQIGFMELCYIKTWAKKNDQRNFTQIAQSSHATSPYLLWLPAHSTIKKFVENLPSIDTTIKPGRTC